MRNIAARVVFTALVLPVAMLAISNQVASPVSAQISEPGWYPYTFARGVDRDIIRETPMHLRPYRPLHFYGNTVRRSYYRGNPLPRFRDIRMTARNLITPSRIRLR